MKKITFLIMFLLMLSGCASQTAKRSYTLEPKQPPQDQTAKKQHHIPFTSSASFWRNGYKISYKTIKKLQQDGIQVIILGDQVELIIPADKIFKFNTATIVPVSYATLDDVSLFLSNYTKIPITVTAFTDNLQDQSFNVDLSTERAQSIVAYLWSHGIPLKNLKAVGKGASHPVASNGNPVGSAYNRRIEITLRTDQKHV